MIPDNKVKVEKDSRTTLGGVTKPKFLPNTKKKASLEPPLSTENATNRSNMNSNNNGLKVNNGSYSKDAASNSSGSAQQFESLSNKHSSSTSYRDTSHASHKNNNTNINQRSVSFNAIGKVPGGRGKGRWATPSFSSATFFSGNNLNIQQLQTHQNKPRATFNGPLTANKMVVDDGNDDTIQPDTLNVSSTNQPLTKGTKIKVERLKSQSTGSSSTHQHYAHDSQHQLQYDPEDDIDSSDSEYEGEDVHGSGSSGARRAESEYYHYDASTVSMQMDVVGEGTSNQGPENESTTDQLSAVSSSSLVNDTHPDVIGTEPMESSSSSSSSSSTVDKKSSFVKYDRPPKVWPPLDYHPLLPLSLPIGPEEIITREKISNFPILSGQDGLENEEIRAYEEEKLCFLLQLPSDLKLEMCQKNTGYNEDHPIHVNDDDGTAPPSSSMTAPSGHGENGDKKVSGNSSSNGNSSGDLSYLKPGKIGKLQVTRSGKVFLVINNNPNNSISSSSSSTGSSEGGTDPPGGQERRYEVWGGMDVSFAQYVSTISLHPPTTSAGSSATTNGSDGNGKQLIKKEKNVSVTGKKSTDFSSSSHISGASGEFHILSDITRKLVVTPEYLTNNNSHGSHVKKVNDAVSGVHAGVSKIASTSGQVGLRSSMITDNSSSSSSGANMSTSPSKKKIEPTLLKPPAGATLAPVAATNFNLVVKQSQKQALLMKNASVSVMKPSNKPATKTPKFNIMSSGSSDITTKPSPSAAAVTGSHSALKTSATSTAAAGTPSVTTSSSATTSATTNVKQPQTSIPIKPEPSNKTK